MNIIKTLFTAALPAIALVGALLISAPGLLAQSIYGYSTRNDVTTTTNNNTVIFVGAPTKTIRLLSVTANSDTNTAILSYIAGTTPTPVVYVFNGTNLAVASTAGVISNQLAILQRGVTSAWLVTVLYTNQLTNVWLAGGSGALGFTPLAGDILWTVTNRANINLPVGQTTLTGQALHMAQVRAPLVVRLSPSGWVSNRVNATVFYETSP